MESEVAVSIICTAYNQEEYIRDCLNGFVMQKTSFKFEVLINDDCSTDHTADVIREYEERYPDIIHAFYQEKNLYSQHISITETVLFPNVRGKYIAFCEGDDYWIDGNKLQKQYEAMEKYPECHFCAHSVNRLIDEKTVRGTIPNKPFETKIMTTAEVIEEMSQEYSFHTCSYFMRTEDFKKYIDEKPMFKQLSDVGDIPIQLYFSTLGKTFFFNDIMSTYRTVSIGSWHQRNKKNKQEHHLRMVEVINEFDKYTNYLYHDSCMQFAFRMYYINATFFDGRFKELRNPQYYKAYQEANTMCKIKVLLDEYFPTVFRWFYPRYRHMKSKGEY